MAPKDSTARKEEFSVSNGNPETTPVEADEGQTFSSIPLQNIIPESPLPCDVYLFLSGHFIKFKHAGDNISAEKFNQFILGRVSHIFTVDKDLEQMKAWSRENAEKERLETLQRVGGEHASLVQASEDIKKEILGIFTKEITNEQAALIYRKTVDFVKQASQTKDAHAALRRLLGHSRTLAEHSVNVANLSLYLAHFLNYSNPNVLRNIYLGALYHDIGKTKIDPNLTKESNPKAYAKAERAHPDLGKTLLLTKTDLPDDVLNIVAEHHERMDGKGYPKKLTSTRIFDLTKIVSIANHFDNLVSEGEGALLERQRRALKLLEDDGGHQFEAKKLIKCIEAISYGL